MAWVHSARVAAWPLLGSALLFLHVNALAADSDDSLDEVIVVANRPTTVGKLDVPMRDQPQNVSVISRERLEEFGRPRIQDIAYATIGLQPVALQQGATSYGFFLRGFNGAPIITDGYYSSNNAFGSVGIIDMATIESVEVLRGPASLLYGQGNPGGVVNLTTKSPQSVFGLNAAAIFDEHGAQRFEGDVTGQLASNVDGRLIGVIEDSDSFRDFINHKRRLFAPQLTAQLGDTLQLKLQYTYDDFRYVPDNGPAINADLIRHLPVERSVQEPGLGHVRTVNQYLRLEADWKISSDWTVRFGAFAHRNRVPDGVAEIDPGPTVRDTVIARDYITTIDPDHNGAEDGMLTAQLLGRFSTGTLEHNLTAAIDYIDNRSKYDYAYYEFTPLDYASAIYTPGPVVPDPNLLQFAGEGAFESTVEAAYLQDLIAIGDRWKVLVGLRTEDIKTVGYADPDATIRTNTTSASKTTPRAGLVFDASDALTLYASYSEAFVPNYGLNFAGDPFKPEESRSYEIGARQQFGNDLLLTVAIYDIEKENILVVDPVHDDFNVNAGVARSKGAELEMLGRLTDAWRIALGLAYNDAQITQSSDPWFPEGDTLPAAAQWSALANTRYAFDGTLEGLSLGINIAYASKRPYVLPNVDTELDAYANVSLFASYGLSDALELKLNINNVADERILLANGYGRAQFEPSRTILLSMHYRLGSLMN
jgi:iron complex outermembrane receptor protein